LQTTVTTVADLRAALANTAIARIVLGDGTYILNSTLGSTKSGLEITRSVILEAAAGATVTLDAQASSTGNRNGPNARRVLYINPGSTGYVQLIRLRITGGYFSCDGWCDGSPNTNRGGGVYIETGTVTMSSCSVYGNRVRQGVRCHRNP
jgi:hypothetical protein